MIELVFLACLATAPTDCQERSLLFTDVTQRRCVMGAQTELAKWIGSHPAWRIGRWTCRPVRHDQQET